MTLHKLKIVILYLLKHFFKIFKNDWTGFYTLMLNNLERKNNFNIIKKQKRKYGFYSLDIGYKFLGLLKKHGLKENDKFLDYGCGYGRIGIPVIEFIKKDKYVGIDLSKERIRIAKDYVKEANLNHKKPILLSSYKKSLSDLLKNKKFDTILIYTVLSHNPPKDVEKILREAKQFLAKDGKIFADYDNKSAEDHYMNILGFKIKTSIKDYKLADEEMFFILKKLNFDYKIINDFIDFQTDKTVRPSSKMLMLSNKNK